MSNIFSDCISFISLYLSNFIAINVADMSNMFISYSSLSSLKIEFEYK